jgi:CRISPR-associated protein Csm4
MKTYRLKLRPQSSFLTPWQADTVFGSLCWIMAWREGADELSQFLRRYKNGEPPFILSDGCPDDLLPAPMHLSLMTPKDEGLESYKHAKKLKKVFWLTQAEFRSVCSGNLDIQPTDDINPIKTFTTLHSSINRISGTTGDEGTLFELEEHAVQASESLNGSISIYLRIKRDWEEKVYSLFKDLSLMGYGKKRSVGKGSFEIVGGLESVEGFNHIQGANGFVSLSNFAPAKNDPTEGFYRTLVKYGKLGGEYTFTGNPFKKPLMMLIAGSSFFVKGDVKLFYGRMVEGISPAMPEVVQYGYAFSVPIVLKVS